MMLTLVVALKPCSCRNILDCYGLHLLDKHSLMIFDVSRVSSCQRQSLNVPTDSRPSASDAVVFSCEVSLCWSGLGTQEFLT